MQDMVSFSVFHFYILYKISEIIQLMKKSTDVSPWHTLLHFHSCFKLYQ